MLLIGRDPMAPDESVTIYYTLCPSASIVWAVSRPGLGIKCLAMLNLSWPRHRGLSLILVLAAWLDKHLRTW